MKVAVVSDEEAVEEVEQVGDVPVVPTKIEQLPHRRLDDPEREVLVEEDRGPFIELILLVRQHLFETDEQTKRLRQLLQLVGMLREMTQ